MEILNFYFKNSSGQVDSCLYAISDWYCKPAILESLAVKAGCLFLTCTKYGCRQFAPKWHKEFPVHCWFTSGYKKGLPFLTIEFNNCADSKPFPDLFDFLCSRVIKHPVVVSYFDMPF